MGSKIPFGDANSGLQTGVNNGTINAQFSLNGDAVDKLLGTRVVMPIAEKDSKSQLRSIQSFLGVSSLPDEHHEKLEGSCRWIDEREDFRNWRDAPYGSDLGQEINHSPLIYWVNAGPGAGKTVLAAYVSSQLKELGLHHAVYHFHVGKKASQSIAGFLRSIAFQMTTSNAAVRDAMTKLQNEGISYDLDDGRAVWSKIFKGGILPVPLHNPQYWVIDAVDECLKYTEIFTLLSGTHCQFPLRIFITSRKLPNMKKLVGQLEDCMVSIVEIPLPDTKRDIELFVRNRMEYLPIDTNMEKQKLREEILSKADASFLWVRLVMDELEGVYGYESIMSVLQEIPEGMKSYYQRTVTDMAQHKREKHIAKSILLWVLSAARPLSISELSEALKLDIKIHLPSARAAIEGLCGQLVYVDKHTDLVHVVHATAREFLLSGDAGEFKISSSESHERIALTCLQLLVSPGMQPPKHRSLVGQNLQKQQASALLDYAITEFSEHVYAACSESDELLVALKRFLSTTVLSWIERIVSKKILHRLIRVARNLRGYFDRRAKYCSPLNQYVKLVNSWTTDLSRLVIKFGRALTLQPQSIYFLIPPLCPTETALYQQFGQTPDGLICSGFNNTSWDDCAATINFENESAAVMTCDNGFIAVGYESGNIHLYNQGSCQKEQAIRHDSPVDLLMLDPFGSFVASTSTKFLTVWDLKGNPLWKKRLRSRCILLTSSPKFIMGVTTSGRAFRWDIATGDQLEEHQYPYQPFNSNFGIRSNLSQAPFAASASPGLELLALAYRAGPICIYQLRTGSWIAWAVENNSRRVAQLVFNPNPEINLLLVAYDDSHLSLYDMWSGVPVRAQPSVTNAVFTSLSCSQDGRTFGTVDVLGNLQIWDFETLTALYHVLTPKQSFRILGFTSDSFSFVDATQQEMRVWSPPALVRRTVEEEAGVSDQAAVLPVAQGHFESFQVSKIRSIVAHEVYSAVFAGNHNGDVLLFNRDDGHEIGILYSHQNTIVKCLAVTKDNVIASGDINGTVQAWHLDGSRPTKIKAGKLLFQAQLSSAICQLLFDQAGDHLLVSTRGSDYVYEVMTGNLIGSLPCGTERGVWKWTILPDPKCANQFTLLSNRKLVTYSANSFPTEMDDSQITLSYTTADGFIEVGIDSMLVHEETRTLILSIRQQSGYVATSSVFIFKLPRFRNGTLAVSIQPTRTLAADLCMHFLGISRADQSLVFLHQSSWVSSINLLALATPHYTQHFFVPSEFITNSNDVLPIQTVNDNFVFSLHNKLAVVKNGLKFQELKAVD
ncbi:NACHT and WD domain protein [Penicillium canariense]|uniref:NACHT and WD domain protein n=1 Tax=Penicillium canariense TaxID=189055 RepID=A0A9W9HMH4_9EURO|nr:NACHT and WD domain protein [Penicillium canariense]KAJ5150912.1 NACHT and WD domain protein [Penicillium canariense]